MDTIKEYVQYKHLYGTIIHLVRILKNVLLSRNRTSQDGLEEDGTQPGGRRLVGRFVGPLHVLAV